MTPQARRVGRPPDKTLPHRRREEIFCAAAKVFASLGYRNTEVQAIADASGMSKGTIYRYFDSKEQLFFATVDRGMQLLQQHLCDANEHLPPGFERMGVSIGAYLAFFDSHPHLVELLIQERAEFRDRKKPTYFEYRDATVDRRRKMLQQMIAEGKVRDMPLDRILDVVDDLLYGVIFTNYFRGRSKSLQAQADDIVDIIKNGIIKRDE